MARKLVAKAGQGEIFSADDFFLDLAGRYRSFYILCTRCSPNIMASSLEIFFHRRENYRYKFQPGLLGEAHKETQRKVRLTQSGLS